jgi:hypothetical protein
MSLLLDNNGVEFTYDIPTVNTIADITVPARNANDPSFAVPTRTVSNTGSMPERSFSLTRFRQGNMPRRLGGNEPQQVVTQVNDTDVIQTPTNFNVLADLFRNVFGASQGIQPVQSNPVIPVPVGAEGGASNTGLILVILAIGGIAVWYFYFR